MGRLLLYETLRRRLAGCKGEGAGRGDCHPLRPAIARLERDRRPASPCKCYIAACETLCVSATAKVSAMASGSADTAGAVPGEASGPAPARASGKGRAGAGELAARPAEIDMEEQMRKHTEYEKKCLLNNIGRDVEIVVRGPVRFYTPPQKRQSR